MKVIGILVCNSEEVLRHKQTDGRKEDGNYCYWEMSRFPNRIKDLIPSGYLPSTGVYSEPCRAPSSGIYDDDDILFPDDVEVRLYFAVKGLVQGYFVCKAMDESELRFHSESWTPISPIPIKPSQGFRYFNHEEK